MSSVCHFQRKISSGATKSILPYLYVKPNKHEKNYSLGFGIHDGVVCPYIHGFTPHRW
jgi:hypothetical protein